MKCDNKVDFKVTLTYSPVAFAVPPSYALARSRPEHKHVLRLILFESRATSPKSQHI